MKINGEMLDKVKIMCFNNNNPLAKKNRLINELLELFDGTKEEKIDKLITFLQNKKKSLYYNPHITDYDILINKGR